MLTFETPDGDPYTTLQGNESDGTYTAKHAPGITLRDGMRCTYAGETVVVTNVTGPVDGEWTFNGDIHRRQENRSDVLDFGDEDEEQDSEG